MIELGGSVREPLELNLIDGAHQLGVGRGQDGRLEREVIVKVTAVPWTLLWREGGKGGRGGGEGEGGKGGRGGREGGKGREGRGGREGEGGKEGGKGREGEGKRRI